MPNGYQIDPLSILHDHLRDHNQTLLSLVHMTGRIEQRLSDGHDLHQEVKGKLDDHGKRLAVVETRLEEEEPKTAARKLLEAFRLLWPFLALSIAIVRMLLGIAGKDVAAKYLEGLQEFLAGFKIEG